MSIRKKLIISSEPDNLQTVMDFVSRTMAPCHFHDMEEYKIVVAINEAVSNIMEHGYPPGEVGIIEIEVDVNKKALVIKIRDEAAPFNLANQPVPNIQEKVNARDNRGYGIFMMRQIVDDIQYARVGNQNELTLVKKR